jgi:antitoxin (DNA-binding transcriptional repressor) of toxin-antitoxin stability system
MKHMIISEFKAKCIATLRDVEKSGEPVVVTRRGLPIVEIDPVVASEGRRLGAQRGAMRIMGDIVRSEFADEWAVCAARS